jgi:hypothetical protein
MRCGRILVLGLAVGLGCRAALFAAPISLYFDSLNTNGVSPFCIRVEKVLEGSPADRAGVEIGDRIVGVEGKRVRDEREYGMIVRCYPNLSELSVTVQRGTEFVNLKFTDLPENRITGCGLVNEPPTGVWDILESRLGIQISDAFKADAKGTAPDVLGDLMEGFSAVKPRFSARPDTLQVAGLPPRAKEAFWRLGARKTDATRQWVLDFIEVYKAMIEEKYKKATDLMAAKRLQTTAPHPFLGQLLWFYGKIAANPPSEAKGIPLQSYGVDPLYFALCYPYPIMLERRTDWFAFNPGFRDAFDAGTGGNSSPDEDLGTLAERFQARPGASLGERYHGCVRSALVALESHGGWPYRSSSIMNDATATNVYAELLERTKTNADEKVSLAFALLIPSVKFQDMRTFTNAYATICEAGTREMGTANAILFNGIRFSQWNRDAMMARRRAIEERYGYPAFYKALSKLSPEFERRASLGYYFRQGQFVDGLSVWCVLSPDVVARALIK